MIMEKRHNGRPLVQRHIRGLIKGEFPACRVAGLHQLRLQTEGICLMSERLGFWPAAQHDDTQFGPVMTNRWHRYIGRAERSQERRGRHEDVRTLRTRWSR